MLNQLQYNKLTLILTLVTGGMTYFLPFMPISPQLAVAIVGFWGMVTSTIKTYQTPPPRSSDVISTAALIVLAALGLLTGTVSCSPTDLQSLQAKALPILTQGQAIGEQVKLVLALADKHGITAPEVAEAAKAVKDGQFDDALYLAPKVLKLLADAGVDVPPLVVSGINLAVDMRAAQGVQAFARWSAVKPDGGT